MTRSRELGMRTFDGALFELYDAGVISFDEAQQELQAQAAERKRLEDEQVRERMRQAANAAARR